MPDQDEERRIQFQRQREKLRAGLRDAVRKQDFAEALSTLNGCLITDALEWMFDVGITLGGPPAGETGTERIVTLADAAVQKVAEIGEACPVRVELAADALTAVARMRLCMDGGHVAEEGPELTNWIAELAVLATDLGRIDMLMHTVRTGSFDTWVIAEWRKERRREGVAKTNARRTTSKIEALEHAKQICSANLTLSHEQVALKIMLRITERTLAVKTLTDWVRKWRQDGSLPSRKPT